jgi:hypothetical protein
MKRTATPLESALAQTKKVWAVLSIAVEREHSQDDITIICVCQTRKMAEMKAFDERAQNMLLVLNNNLATSEYECADPPHEEDDHPLPKLYRFANKYLTWVQLAKSVEVGGKEYPRPEKTRYGYQFNVPTQNALASNPEHILTKMEPSCYGIFEDENWEREVVLKEIDMFD